MDHDQIQELHDKTCAMGARCHSSEDMQKSNLRTLYVHRKVLNADAIIQWAKSQGFEKTLSEDDLHVTVAYSTEPVDWDELGEADQAVHVRRAEKRSVKPLGDKGAMVLLLESPELSKRHSEILEKGASWDYDGYRPHVTITYSGDGVDLSKVEPFSGSIVLGPEVFSEVDDTWSENVVEKARVCKVDESLGLVFGWAIVSEMNNQPYFDVQGDHIPEGSMLKAASDFMQSERVAKEMHVGDGKGKIVFAWPMTKDIAKAMGIKTDVTGLMIAMKPDTQEILEKFRSGEYTGFSIGGNRVRDKELNAEEAAAMVKIKHQPKSKPVVRKQAAKKEEEVKPVAKEAAPPPQQAQGQNSPVSVYINLPEITPPAPIVKFDPVIQLNPEFKMPEQPAPIINIPEQPAPIVNVEPKIEVRPEIKVDATPRGVEKMKVTKHDAQGRILETVKTYEE